MARRSEFLEVKKEQSTWQGVFFLPHKKKLVHHMKEEGQSLAGPERAEPVQRWHGMLPGLLNH